MKIYEYIKYTLSYAKMQEKCAFFDMFGVDEIRVIIYNLSRNYDKGA